MKSGEPSTGAVALAGTGTLPSKRSRTVKTMPPHSPLCASPMVTFPSTGRFTVMSGSCGKELMNLKPLVLGLKFGTKLLLILTFFRNRDLKTTIIATVAMITTRQLRSPHRTLGTRLRED